MCRITEVLNSIIQSYSLRSSLVDVVIFLVIMNNVTDTTALVAASIPRGELVVAFRGTMNAMNIIQDAALIPMPYPETPGVKLHTGFVAAVMSLYKEVSQNGHIRSFVFL